MWKKMRTARKAPKKSTSSAPRRRAKIAVTKVKQRTLPDKLIVKLPYTDLQGFNGGSGDYRTQKSYNINGCYDPETGAFNQQNLAWAKYMTIYKKYRVFKVDYDVSITNTSDQTIVGGSVSFNRQSDNQMDITDISQLSVPYSRRFTLSPKGTTGATKRIRGSIWLPRLLGFTSEQFRTNDALVGSANTNPLDTVQMSLNCINANTSVQATIQADVRYTCHCELFSYDISELGTTAPSEE